MGLLREQCAEWKKGHLWCCCSQVWMKNGGQIPSNVPAFCETFKISCLMGRHHMKGVLGNHWKDRLFHLVHWLSITVLLRRTSQEPINSERNTHCTRVEFGRVTYWLQTLRSWRRWTHRKSTQKKTQCERGDISQRKRRIIFPIENGRIKPLGGDQELRTSTLIRQRPTQGESHLDFLRESEGSLPPPHDSFPDAGEATNDFWSMSGNFIHHHHVEPRVKLYSPREESFPIPLKYIDVSRNYSYEFGCQARETHRWLLEYRWVKRFVRSLDRFHSILLEEKAPNGYMWSGVRLTRKQLTSRPDHLWPELWKSMGKHAKLKEKQKWSREKPKLDNARKLRGIYFIDPEDKEYKETIKNARKKLETPVAPAMPCKMSMNRTQKRNLVKFLEPTKKPKVSYSLEFGKSCEELSWNHCTSTRHTDQKQMGLQKEQCEEWQKGHLRCCCSQVWMKNGGQIPSNVSAFCETFKISCLMGRHLMKGGSEYHSMARSRFSVWFIGWISA